MNFFKKIVAKLTSMEFGPVPRDPMDDPRTRILTRGPTKSESAQEKFARERREAAELAEEERKANQERGRAAAAGSSRESIH